MFDLTLLSSPLSPLVLPTEIIRAERLQVVRLTAHSAVLQWRPLQSKRSGYYELWYRSVWKADSGNRRFLPGESSWVELSNLHPDTTYIASLQPESNQSLFHALSVNFTTPPGEGLHL